MDQQLLQWISTSGRLLGSLFYYEPTDPRIQPVLDFFLRPDWTEQWMQADNLNDIRAQIQHGLNRDLSEQHQALFIGPNALPAPPWGSVYLDPEAVIFGNSLLELRQFLRKNAIEFSVAQEEPEDHVGLMLLLSAYLAENKPNILPAFLSQHFLTWSGRYLTLLTTQNDYPFYQGLGLLTQQTLQQWQEALALDIPKVQFYR